MVFTVRLLGGQGRAGLATQPRLGAVTAAVRCCYTRQDHALLKAARRWEANPCFRERRDSGRIIRASFGRSRHGNDGLCNVRQVDVRPGN
jgi:hypothetical protein